jgi:hypothetical protein
MTSFFSMPRVRAAAGAFAAVVGGAACTSLTESNLTPNRYGSISVQARNNGAQNATANGTAIFFEAFSAVVPNSSVSRTDDCVITVVDTTTVVSRGTLRAGGSVNLSIGSAPVSLAFEDANTRYLNARTTPFTYRPGDSLTVSVPGETNGYPSGTLRAKLAEPIIPGPVVVPSGTAPMSFTWNATNDSTAAVILALRYANPATVTYANEQVYCQLRDDGAHQLASSALTNFLRAPLETRSLLLIRWRTRQAQLDSRTALHIASSVDTTVRLNTP